MKIKKLPPETRSKLQSGIIITDAVQCVLELVHNSLDAEATGIAVKIDLKQFKIQVIDNGCGIGKDDLELVGQRFMTSKYQPAFEAENSFPTYGFKGEALSSLQEVCTFLIIETKSENEGPTFRKVFKNNKPSPITKADCDRQGTGTTVIVEDFMHTMPVRRKRISEVFDMEEVKNQLQYLAVIHYNVCFTLKNENKNLILLQTPQASSTLEAVSNVYSKNLAKSLNTLYYKENNYEITGFISLKPKIQENVQLLYVNRRIVTKSVIHKFINNLTKEYNKKKTLLSNSPVGKVMKSLKGFSHSAYIIQIKCPHSYYELFTNLRKTTVEFKNWKDLLKCVHKAIRRTCRGHTDSLSSNQECDKEVKDVKDKKERRGFGTSFLLNAVKGAPVKRNLNIKKEKKRKKMKMNENKENSGVLLPKITDKTAEKKLADSLNTITLVKECTDDSFESPIPKKRFLSKKCCNLKQNDTRSVNQSIVEFYEWLKAKFETDTNAFNLYNDFLQFKNADKVAEFKSPVLIEKPKKVSQRKRKKSLENQIKLCDGLSFMDEEISIMTKKQLKILPNTQLRMQKAVEFSELKRNIPENINLDLVRSSKWDNYSVFKKPENLTLFNNNQAQIEYSPSVASSEMQFTNVIKFRNLPENFFQQPSDIHFKIPISTEVGYSVSNSWASHYQNFVSKNIELLEMEGQRNFSWLEAQERDTRRKKDNFDFDNLFESNLIEFTHKAKKCQKVQNAEIQVDLSKIHAQKVNAMVQTNQEVPESSSLESSYVFHSTNNKALNRESGDNFQEKQNECLENDLSQGVPDTDFWNTTAHMELEKENNVEIRPDITDTATRNLTNDVVNDKNSATDEFICGHKSQSSTKPQSEKNLSKETQTLIAIWTDSLTELGYGSEKVKTNTDINSKSESTEVAKTIPIEEIQQVISENNQFEFCLTERHDFMPKGLSPQFLYPETSKILTLSPFEKCKLQLTIDDTQNELLAKIKWQDDTTGDCVKPIIPDRILFEMRRKAGESVMNYENPILSASMSYCAVKVHNLLHSFAFTKELLSDVEILGQLDKKFIVAKIKIATPKKMELVSLFDQHAVDERIKLEEIIKENVSTDGKLASSCLNPPLECFLTESDLRIISDLQEKMSNYGLGIKAVNENTIIVNEIPTFLLNKHEKDLKNKKDTSLLDIIKALIINIVNETTETRGVASKIPKIIHNAFCLEACHKAIKFNKALTKENMNEMIIKLQSCKLPFQCAHGRPSVIPIIDLEDFNTSMDEKKSIDFQELKKFFNERKHDIIATDETA